MDMSITLLVAILCAGTAVSQVQVPCYGEGCANVTVYLGPRWGSRVIIVPRGTTTARPRVTTTSGASKLGGNVKISGDRFEVYDDRNYRPQHRPVPQGGEMQVDFMDDEPLWRKLFPTTESPYKNNRWDWWSRTTTRQPPEQPWWRRTTTRSPPEQPWWRWRTSTTRSPSDARTIPTNYPGHDIRVNWKGTLDLSRRGYSGEDVKQALMTLSESDRRYVTRLILDGNKIQYLPDKIFPMEFEYGLIELSLSDNPISPSVPWADLDRNTAFELSRLRHLKTLNMSRCDMKSIELPYLPSLEVLDLSYNKMTYLPQSLGDQTGLLQLFLRGNELRHLYQTTLTSLLKLWVLDLGDNGLEELSGEPLENLENLVTVKLDGNYLKSMPRLDAMRTKIVFLNTNSLYCSCSLLRWLEQPNLQIQDVYGEKCQDGYNKLSVEQMMMSPRNYQYLCAAQEWWGARVWNALALWYRRNSDILRNIYKVVGVTIFVVALLAILRKRNKLMAKVKPQAIPYDALDDKKISIVSGPQSHEAENLKS